jgi:hypothetical protein
MSPGCVKRAAWIMACGTPYVDIAVDLIRYGGGYRGTCPMDPFQRPWIRLWSRPWLRLRTPHSPRHKAGKEKAGELAVCRLRSGRSYMSSVDYDTIMSVKWASRYDADLTPKN